MTRNNTHVGEAEKTHMLSQSAKFSLHMILIKGREGKNERKAHAGRPPGVDRLRKLSRNSNNAGSCSTFH